MLWPENLVQVTRNYDCHVNYEIKPIMIKLTIIKEFHLVNSIRFNNLISTLLILYMVFVR